MKKLQLLALCSLIAIGSGNNLQTSLSRSEPAKGTENKSMNDPTINAKTAVAREAIARENAIKAGDEVAKVVNAKALIAQTENLSQASRSNFVRNKNAGQNAANMAEGTAKDTAVKNVLEAVVTHVRNRFDQNIPDDAFNSIKTEAIKNAKTWSETWNELSFIKLINSIVESVSRYFNKSTETSQGINLQQNTQPAGGSTDVNLTDGGNNFLSTNSFTGGKTNSNQTQNYSSAQKSQMPSKIGTVKLSDALVKRGQNLQNINEGAKNLNQGSSEFLSIAKQLKEEQQNATFSNGYGLFN